MTLEKFAEATKILLGLKAKCHAEIVMKLYDGKVVYLSDGGNRINPKTGQLEDRYKRIA